MGKNAKPMPAIPASRGEVEVASARPLAAIDGYRIMFNLKPTDDSVAPTDVRVYLVVDGQPLSETWRYQWTPPPVDQRHV
jgi:glucans biosynthesis protein